MKEYFQPAINTLKALNFSQRITIGTLVVASVLVLVFMTRQSQDDYDVMFSGMEDSDAAAVVHNLKEQGIPYKLAENGTTILVPRSRKEELRLNAFSEDLIKSEKTVGFGALGSLPFGMTEWQERKYDQKIISDEISRTLEHVKGIKKARVILAKGDESLFDAERVEPTASVMLIVEPGFRLKSEQVRTIRQMVAKSVPGMKPSNVALADSMGNSLSDDTTLAQGDGEGGLSESDTIRINFEKQKSKDIMEMLAPVVGGNNAVVKVSAKMNFDHTESKIKRFIPTGGTAENPTGIPVSVQQNSEVYDGEKPKEEGGQPGVASNAPSYGTKDDPTAKKDNKYNNQQLVTNYEVSSEEQTIVHAPGSVEKLSVAVIVNKVLTDSEVKELTQLVSTASGIDASRGDTVAVSGLQFSPEAQEQNKAAMDALKDASMYESIVQLAQYFGLFVLTIVALFLGYKLLKRPVEGELMEDEYYEDDHYDVPALSSMSSALAAMGPEPMLAAASLPALEARLDPEIEQMREALHSMVNNDPQDAARVLVSFMNDG